MEHTHTHTHRATKQEGYFFKYILKNAQDTLPKPGWMKLNVSSPHVTLSPQSIQWVNFALDMREKRFDILRYIVYIYTGIWYIYIYGI